METYFTSDSHFGDTRCELMRRPFDDPELMIEHQIQEFNKLVTPDDHTHFLGDFTFWGATHLVELAGRMNGTKTLYLGNHDFAPLEEYEKYFDEIYISRDITLEHPETGETLDVHINHYPSLAVPHRFNLVGHIHDAWKVQRNMLNVGVDAWHFRPIPVKMIFQQYRMIREFYDDDVFVDTLDANLAAVPLTNGKGSRVTSEFVVEQHRKFAERYSD